MKSARKAIIIDGGFGSITLANQLRRAAAKSNTPVKIVASLPYKCPVAPLEFVCLADEFFTRKGMRNKVNMTVVTSLTGAFTKPVCNDMLTDMLVEKNVSAASDRPNVAAEGNPAQSRRKTYVQVCVPDAAQGITDTSDRFAHEYTRKRSQCPR